MSEQALHRFRRRPGWARRRSVCLALLLAVTLASPCLAGPFIWDEDGDRLDDRIESVNLLGYTFSFELGDTLLRQRFDVTRVLGGLAYGVYVVYEQAPSDQDLLALTLLGMPTLHRIEAVPAVRSVATFLQAEVAATLPNVERVEVVPLLYLGARDGAATIAARDPSHTVFPTWFGERSERGEGQVIAFLDTGINDAFDALSGYPGHQSLLGRCVGGALFLHGDSTADTPRNGSTNPVDRGGDATRAHGTHVAAIAIGAGADDGAFTGVAPGARFVDVKVLNDAGFGTGVPEALDWCIANRQRDWGAGPAWQGIDVINLSLSSLDLSDGNDLASRLAHRATELGMVVVASMGNEPNVGEAPSPASGDGVIAVGAWDAQRSASPGDDGWPAFNRLGPRASDGDGDALDELKPTLLAAGVAVLSADGRLNGSDDAYQRLTGTSMSAAFVSGAIALLRSAFPELGPAEIEALLAATARRNLGAIPGSGSPADVRWASGRGYGLLDLHAALLERTQPQRSQLRRLRVEAQGASNHLTLWTQRERGAAHFVFERAPDVNGAPGAFVAFDSVAAGGDSSLADASNLVAYERDSGVAPEDLGAAAWWRVAYTENGVRYEGPAVPAAQAAGPSRATIEVTIVHDAYDEDVVAWLEPVAAGSPGQGLKSTGPQFELPGSTSAVAVDWVSGTSATGRTAWTFRVEIPEGAADAWLPPDAQHPWALRVAEGGYLNRTGRVTDYQLTWHATSGDLVFEGAPTPLLTVDGQTVSAYAPQATLSVGDGIAHRRALRSLPNPVVSGGPLRFALPGGARDIAVFDLAGREVMHVPASAWRDGIAERAARDDAGRALPAGVYFARHGDDRPARLVVLSR